MNLLIPGLVVLAILVMMGVGLSLTLIEVRRQRLDLARRIRLVTGSRGEPSSDDDAGLTERSDPGWSELLGTWLRAACAVGLTHTWGMKAGAPALVVSGIGGAVAAWLVLHSGLHMSTWVAVPVTMFAFIFAPRALLKHQQSGADRQFMEAFPETIDMVIRMLRAGLPITAAVRSVGDEAPPPVCEVFTLIADQMAIGITFEAALSAAAHRVGLTDFQFFAVAIALQRSTGGNLTGTLDILSDIMRKRRGMRLKAKATTGEVRMSAYVLGAIPFLVIGGLLIMTPDYLAPMLADRRGNIIIGVAVVSLLIGFGTIRQMMRSVTNAT